MITIEDLYKLYLSHPIVSTDTRKLPEGCLFFALRGANFDGNKYAGTALEAGAAYAIIDEADQLIDERTILVPDALEALQLLAAHHRRALGIPVIAITGTNGKTTTKELTAAVLSQSYDLLYTEGNLNNHIGVPLTLLRLTPEHQLALIEMGASKPGDIAELCAIAQPNYGLITNIGQAHLEGFGSLEGVRRTKGELYDSVRAREGILFYHEEDEVLRQMSLGTERISYGSSPKAYVQGVASPSTGESLFLHFSWSCPILEMSPREVQTQLVGDYNLANALAAIAIGLYFDVPSDKIDEALTSYCPSNSRSQLIHSERGNQIIADAYNANPSSMRTALSNFLAIEPALRPRIVILGDMNELGASSHEAHQELYQKLSSTTTPPLEIYLCGPHWREELGDQPQVYPNVEELIAHIEAHPITKSLILVKGSNSIHLGKLLPYL